MQIYCRIDNIINTTKAIVAELHCKIPNRIEWCKVKISLQRISSNFPTESTEEINCLIWFDSFNL
jgi:hypothetical protein